MAIIKYKEGVGETKKILLKNGKASCECCESACCMYPADSFGSISDLPDTVNFNGNTLSKNGTSYGTTESGVILENGAWQRYINGEIVSSANCLIVQYFEREPCNPGIVTDNFSTSYYVDSSGMNIEPDPPCPGGYYSNSYYRGRQPPPYDLRDYSCCAWVSDVSNCSEDPPQQESGGAIFYNGVFIDDLPYYKWVCAVSSSDIWGVKIGNQNSPVGVYPMYLYSFGIQGPFQGTIVVS
jgi:hypothetical protein